MVNLADWPYIFIWAIVGLGISGVVSLIIGGAVFMGADIIVRFFELSFW